MEENKKLELTEKEYEIITFYRKLSEKKKRKFLKLLNSLRKILVDDDQAGNMDDEQNNPFHI